MMPSSSTATVYVNPPTTSSAYMYLTYPTPPHSHSSPTTSTYSDMNQSGSNVSIPSSQSLGLPLISNNGVPLQSGAISSSSAWQGYSHPMFSSYTGKSPRLQLLGHKPLKTDQSFFLFSDFHTSTCMSSCSLPSKTLSLAVQEVGEEEREQLCSSPNFLHCGRHGLALVYLDPPTLCLHPPPLFPNSTH